MFIEDSLHSITGIKQGGNGKIYRNGRKKTMPQVETGSNASPETVRHQPVKMCVYVAMRVCKVQKRQSYDSTA